jgi:murein DD-endopeptidase MepM/ murein hydrolase activator NlpD
MRSLLVLVLSLGLAGAARGQELAMAADVRWEPGQLQQGTLIYLIVNPNLTDDGITITGQMAGQELHFERDPSGEFRAVAPIPVNAMETIPFTFAVVQRADTSHRMVRVPVQPREFRSSRLSVDPRFSDQPDSALRERIRRESGQSVAVSLRSHDTPRMWDGEWIPPRQDRITSEFGVRRVFNGELRSRHYGVDFDGETGDPIVASNRGVVALVGDFYYSGNVVYLDHGKGLITIYMHMSEVDVTEGQIVERGQQLGRVGATGRVTGPHVHWIARYSRISVDGLSLFDLPIPDGDAVVDEGT